jgi:hypothetical protein
MEKVWRGHRGPAGAASREQNSLYLVKGVQSEVRQNGKKSCADRLNAN